MQVRYAVDRIRDTYQPRITVDLVLVVLAALGAVVLAVVGAPFVAVAVVGAFGLLRLLDLLRVAVILRGVRATPVQLELDRAGVVLHTARGAEPAGWDDVEAVRLEDEVLLRFVVRGRKDVTYAVQSLDVEPERLTALVRELSDGRHAP